jgi:ribosomal protein L9
LSSLPGPLEFVRAAIPDTTTTFGSVTSEDIVEKLKEYDIILDKRLVLNEKVKSLGRHEIAIKCGESQVNIDVMVKAA